MVEMICKNIPSIYSNILDYILRYGSGCNTRLGMSREYIGMSIVSSNPRKRFFMHKDRNANPIFSIAELLWILRGDASAKNISFYVSDMMNYANPVTGQMDGGYGPRLIHYAGAINQLEVIYNRLKVDPNTRRAICVIYNPALDWKEESLDIPCNISLQFILRNNRLNMIVYVRSQDMFRGFVYDTEEWQMLQEIIAGWLRVNVGKYYHYMASAHIYEKDLEVVEKIIRDQKDYYSGIRVKDARLTKPEYDDQFYRMFYLENRLRNGFFYDYYNLVDYIENDFWRSAITSVASYCAYKHGRLDLMREFVDMVTNELKSRLIYWYNAKGLLL